jgi:glycosyltransferase involved in cell wall biosynthesis
MRAPKVSVLIPVFNGEKFLAETVASILAQDFADCEILFSDDGSTDGSVALLEQFAARDPRIRWWRNAHNLGLAANFNCCLRAARGEFVKFVLQDDLLLAPTAVSRLVAALEADATVALAASASHIIDEASRWRETRDYFPAGVTDGKKIIGHCLEKSANLIGEPSLVMFRRAHAGRGFDEGYRQIVDLEFWFHLLEQGAFAYLAEPLAAFRIHAQQQTAVNRQTGVGEREQVQLLELYLARPWMRAVITRQMLFSQIYHLRRATDERSRSVSAALRAALPPPWYAVYWVKRKLVRPFARLWRWGQRQAPR